MKKQKCSVCNNLRSARNIYKGVCKACRNKDLTHKDKLPCILCGDIEQPKKFYMNRLFCPSCLKKVKWLPKDRLSAAIELAKK